MNRKAPSHPSFPGASPGSRPGPGCPRVPSGLPAGPLRAAPIPSAAPGKGALLLFLTLLALASCRTRQQEERPPRPLSPPPAAPADAEETASLMFDLSPREGELYFFALVSRKQFRNQEGQACREEAARQLSRFFQINGVTYSRTRESVRGTRIKEAAGIAFDDDRAQRLEEELTLLREIRSDEGTAALFSYRPEKSISPPYVPAFAGDAPDWIDRALHIPGYQSAVGFTGPQRFLARTLRQADKNALATLLEQRSGSLNITQQDWERSSGAASSASDSVEKAAGSLRSAYILSRWIDPRGNVYSLAVCPLP